jgi:hypothetical protein
MILFTAQSPLLVWGILRTENAFARAAGRPSGYRPPRGTSQCRHAISRTPHQFSIPMDQIQDRDVDPTQPNEALSRLVSRTSPNLERKNDMSLGTILIIILIVALLGGFTGVVGGYGYGFGHGGVGVLGTVLIVVLILVLLGRL